MNKADGRAALQYAQGARVPSFSQSHCQKSWIPFLLGNSHSIWSGITSQSGFYLHFPSDEWCWVFLKTHWQFLCFLPINDHLDLEPIFNWVVVVRLMSQIPFMFWILPLSSHITYVPSNTVTKYLTLIMKRKGFFWLMILEVSVHGYLVLLLWHSDRAMIG